MASHQNRRYGYFGADVIVSETEQSKIIEELENCHLVLTSENASKYLRQRPREGNTHAFYRVRRIYFDG